jgi:hypothetical protein
MDEIAPWEQFIRSTALHQFVYLHEPWLWPTCEIIHYLGLSLLLGTVGLFDLRVLGIAKNIPPRAIHRLVPLGIGGYFLNVMTGILFFSGHPDQYFYNNSGRLKALLMAVAGINVLVFYGTSAFPAMKKLEGGMDAPMRIKVIAGVSLAMWVGVLICGRMLTWFRPPFFH